MKTESSRRIEAETKGRWRYGTSDWGGEGEREQRIASETAGEKESGREREREREGADWEGREGEEAEGIET